MNAKHTVAYIQESSSLKTFRLLKRIIKIHKIDRVIRHFSDKNIDIMLKFLFKSKNIVRFFHNGYSSPKKPIIHKITRFIWKNNKLVGVSDAISKEVKNHFPDFSVTSIVNAIQFDRLNNIDNFNKENSISLLMMGWDYHRKGVDLAIKAAHSLRKKYDIILQLVGGRNEDKIKKIAYDILGNDIEWIRFLPPTNNIGTYYTNSDIFLSPSRQEAFGYANIEAAYCKNSIVLSKVDGQGELKIDGAYWIESNNLEDFIEKLELAILELKTPNKISQKAKVREQVMQIYSLEEWTNKLVNLL